MNTLELVRDSYSDMGTFGKLYINGHFFCFTIERPWRNNTPKESCIPEGTYKLSLRYSPMIQKTSGGEYSEGYEITNVPNRQYIMIHPANFYTQLEGCVACGDSLGTVDGKWAVLNSKQTFKKLMAELEKGNDWDIVIRQYLYPGD